MAPSTELAALEAHLRACGVCRDVLAQMHPTCAASTRRSGDSWSLDAGQRARVWRACTRLHLAAKALESAPGDAGSDVANLLWLIKRASRAARHLLELGFLTDSDLEFGGTPVRRRTRRQGATPTARIAAD